MMKYFIGWIGCSAATGFLLYVVVSAISRTTFTNILREFEVMLMLIGFSVLLSTVVICTKYLSDRMNADK
ncbi:hypothetical protein J3A84_07945 [Proteiniclasticum sp. SCR006]|uniref:Uncharacterized protein n=1 Tax=Proteiniclasticum aestuarii TaxID=2817862 RepID=A0A939KJA1_9CLOT|nr:hypothetical protein [Proteiniclasticum aestuarii]MBO1264958.1 hypothetical protein [Proteiniclasticum aestuarii]